MSLAETSTFDVNHDKNRFGTAGPYKYCLASPLQDMKPAASMCGTLVCWKRRGWEDTALDRP